MKKYFGLVSLFISLITFIILPNTDLKLGILGIIIGTFLVSKAQNGILKYVSYVILALCVLLLLFLIVMGFLIGGLVDMDSNKLP